MNKDYKKLHEISTHTRILEGILSQLHWDQETYMPSGAASIRGEQNKTLTGIIHQEKTGKKFSAALSKLIDIKTGKILGKDLDEKQIAALKEWRRDYVKETTLPTSFVEKFAKLTSDAVLVWRSAKNENAFQKFAPFLEKIIAMTREKAEYLGYQHHPYDALLDIYEPFTTTKEIEKLFSDLKKDLKKLLGHIQASKQIDDQFLFGKFSPKKQMEFAGLLLEGMGYDTSKGRLDISSHPFSSAAHPTDSRITSRIHPTSLMSNISSVMHECGHALYEMGLPPNEYGSPLGEAISLGMHESQSRFWETRIGQSKPFWEYYFPLLKKEFNGSLEKVSLNDFYRAINKVTPSLIRVEADEVTYSLHVILRFELEKALIEGSLAVRDLPDAWNEQMQQLLGIKPTTNTEGCLQDIHWSLGSFGYFPTYTLGNLYASHLFTAFEVDFPNWPKLVGQGELLFIKDWLTKNIFCHGRRYHSQDLLKKITGKQFSSAAYTDYLSKKYKNIYQ